MSIGCLVKKAAVGLAVVWGAGWAAVVGDAARLWALTPEQVAVIVNGYSPASREVADYYAKARKIPADHFITVNVDVGEGISDADYQKRIVAPVRQYLVDHKLDDTVTCLVTTYDMPLRVGRKVPTPAEQKLIDVAHKELVAAVRAMQDALAKYDALLPVNKAPASAPATGLAAATAPAPALKTDPTSFAALLKQFQKAVSDAAQRIAEAPAGPERTAAFDKFHELQKSTQGWAGTTMVLELNRNTMDNAEFAAQMKAIVTRVRQTEARIAALADSAHDMAGHAKIAELMCEARGQVALAVWLENQLADLEQVESEAAVDNELTMLWVDRYPRTRWIDNPQSLKNWMSSPDHTERPHLMMVSRLDGATPQAVMDMIATSLKTEEKGLDGAMYLDARGLHGTDDYAAFDSDLRAAATYLKDNTNMKVVLDDKPALLEAKDCPDAALYCGWYSLRAYHDSCQWLPGAVGYHVASLECVSLHNPKETGWAVNLLKHGFGGTLGAVSEPYLHSFPQPSLFFPLLLSGRYTQTEVYSLTCPLLSWRITWLGDPLYNPFKAKPRITTEQLHAHPILRHAAEILPPLEAAPTDNK